MLVAMLEPHLEDGVLLLLLWAVARGVLPWDLEALRFTMQPDEAWVQATVHLGHQPGLQAHSAGVQGHDLKG